MLPCLIRWTALFLLCLAPLLSTGCSSDTRPEVDLSKREVLTTTQPENASSPVVAIGIGSMITPKEGYIFYRHLLDYIEERLGMHVQVVDVATYSEMNKLLKQGKVSAAFVCGGPYVEGHKDFGLELLAAPVVNGEQTYKSYLIVPVDSQVDGFNGLKGKTFAYADPKSNSGYLVPRYQLTQMGRDPDTFFSETLFTYGHDRSILAVAEKAVDGAAVDSLIYEYMRMVTPEVTSRTKVVGQSDSFGIPPIVTGPGVSAELRDQLREILMRVHMDKKGRTILKGMNIDRFDLIGDEAYASIREMEESLSRTASY